MSLVDEAVVNILNRRFISTYYNAEGAIGADADAEKVVSNLGGQIKYGAIITPEGRLVDSFGYGRHEVFLALQLSLLKNPKYNWMSNDEMEAVAAAETNPGEANAVLAAAKILGELMEFDRAEKLLLASLKQEKGPKRKSGLLYQLGHNRLINLNKPARKGVIAAYSQIGNPVASLSDDIAMDRLQLDVVQVDGPFFGGWRFGESVDLSALKQELEALISENPHSNRIGQMQFYLGLCHYQLGGLERANQIWTEHFSTYKEDRWAILSRIHHTDYLFSPLAKPRRFGGTVVTLDERLESARRFVKPLREHGVEVVLPEVHSDTYGSSER